MQQRVRVTTPNAKIMRRRCRKTACGKLQFADRIVYDGGPIHCMSAHFSVQQQASCAISVSLHANWCPLSISRDTALQHRNVNVGPCRIEFCTQKAGQSWYGNRIAPRRYRGKRSNAVNSSVSQCQSVACSECFHRI